MEESQKEVRILIVEDEQIIAADLGTKLTSMGHEIVGTAASGAEVIQMAKQFRPELALMDIQLRGRMNGIEAAREIQQLTGTQIIFVTAYAGAFLSNPQQMQQPGICLSKPYSRYQLETVLNAVRHN